MQVTQKGYVIYVFNCTACGEFY